MAINYDFGGRGEYEDTGDFGGGLSSLGAGSGAPTVLSDEQLYQLTGSWDAAAALRDEQNNALNAYNWSQAAPTSVAAPTTTATAADTTSNAGNVLSGNILAGASWNSTNNTLADQLTAATGQQTLNTAVGGATTADTLNQLNTFIGSGGSFAPGATVFLQTGGVDMLQGVDQGTIANNINQIVSTLGAQGVNVVLTGSPQVSSMNDVTSGNFGTGVASFYNDIAANNSNVSLVDSMGSILQDKSLLRDVLHTNAAGEQVYNQSVIDAYNRLVNSGVDTNTAATIAVQQSGAGATTGGLPATTPADTTTATFGGQNYTLNTADVDNVLNQIVGQNTMGNWTGEGFGSAEANARKMAENLVASGVTDINQIGQKTITTPGYYTSTEQGDYWNPETTQTVLVNKTTGQQLVNDYGERGGVGNAFSGTYTGEGNTAYNVGFDAQGKPILYTSGASSADDLSDLQMILSAASFIPGVAPFAQAANAAISAGQGNWTGAALGALGAAGSAGFTDIGGIPINDAKNFVGGLNAIKTGNVAGLLNSAANYAGANLPSEVRTGLTIANAANAFANNDLAGLVDAAGSLTGSGDAKLAASALRLTDAFNRFEKTGDASALASAASAFNNAATAANTNNTAFTAFKDVIAAGGTPEDALAASNQFDTALAGVTPTTLTQDLPVSAEAEDIISQVAGIQPDQLAFAGAVPALGSAAAAQTTALMQRLAATPAGQTALREAAIASTKVRDALIATGIFGSAGVASFLQGASLVPEKLNTQTSTQNSDLVNQIPTGYTPRTQTSTVTTTPGVTDAGEMTVTATRPANIDVLEGLTNTGLTGDQYNEAGELLIGGEVYTPGSATDQVSAEVAGVAQRLNISNAEALAMQQTNPGLFNQYNLYDGEGVFTPANPETMRSTDLIQGREGGADDNIVINNGSNTTGAKTLTPITQQQYVTPGVTTRGVTTVTPTIQTTTTPTATVRPTATVQPTVQPTATVQPTVRPTATVQPTVQPTATVQPTVQPTATVQPTVRPTVGCTVAVG